MGATGPLIGGGEEAGLVGGSSRLIGGGEGGGSVGATSRLIGGGESAGSVGAWSRLIGGGEPGGVGGFFFFSGRSRVSAEEVLGLGARGGLDLRRGCGGEREVEV